MSRIAALAILMIVCFAGQALAQTTAMIQRLNDKWAAAFDKGNAASVAAMYTADAYVLPPLSSGTERRLRLFGTRRPKNSAMPNS